MIKSIVLKNVASYKNETTLTTDKRVNLIYGLNGAGKTQISRFLASYSRGNDDEVFQECSLNIDGDAKILVYNQDFVDSEFYTSDPLKGIFSLSQEDIAIVEQIEKLNSSKIKLEAQKQKHEEQKEQCEELIIKEYEELKEKLWEIKGEKIKKGSILENLLVGKKQKQSFCVYMLKIFSKEKVETQIDIKDLENRYRQIQETQEEIQPIQDINIKTLFPIEQDLIFQESIVGNENSTIAGFIKELGNESWVKAGREWISEDSGKCPFCQGETITLEFREQIKSYFDENYEKKLTILEQNLRSYESEIKKIPSIESFERKGFLDLEKDGVRSLYDKLIINLEKNLRFINEKIHDPSQKIKLSDSGEYVDKLNKIFGEKNLQIDAFNQELRNKKEARGKIEKEFWEYLSEQCFEKISDYKEIYTKKQNEIEGYCKAILALEGKIQKGNKDIEELEKNTSTTKEAVSNINSYLEGLGICSFRIVQVEEDNNFFYRITRDFTKKDIFTTLSEGEKTLISFLYFLEICKGKRKQDEEYGKKIIVIDDPISSLSHNYVFDMAQLIKDLFLEEKCKISHVEQIFILTHHLYFFHELRGYKEAYSNNIQCFRILKSDGQISQIEKIGGNQILNEYQSYWQILKDCRDNQNPNYLAVIPNIMRNILEYFLGFTKKSKINIIKRGESELDKAFYRYINRESHSFMSNIVDGKEVDFKFFLNKFRQVFDDLGYLEHYETMMKENQQEDFENEE
ncbi:MULTISPECIES: AAA family ATPase [unclassified Helicobacter]|uniref:AAA family ATPase n=1 Tax=unclassified Helicobacter TaxID=2593540 RepID=UPI000CF18215|nr:MULTISPECIES: AAA family ATPase [unclassified Helicobacter]